MTLGGRIHLVAEAFAVGYLFVGSVVLRSEGALAMNVPKMLLGAVVGWVVWMATGVDGRKGSERGDLAAPAAECVGGTVLGAERGNLAAPAAENVSTGEATAKRPLGSCGGTVLKTESGRTRPVRYSPDCMKRRSELAFCDGRIVEAAYWMAIASLHEGLDCSERMMDYVEAWQAVGCPEGRELVHSGFTAAQCYFGWLVLCFHSGTELALAIAELDRMANGGNEDARAFLEANGIGSGDVV